MRRKRSDLWRSGRLAESPLPGDETARHKGKVK